MYIIYIHKYIEKPHIKILSYFALQDRVHEHSEAMGREDQRCRRQNGQTFARQSHVFRMNRRI